MAKMDKDQPAGYGYGNHVNQAVKHGILVCASGAFLDFQAQLFPRL